MKTAKEYRNAYIQRKKEQAKLIKKEVDKLENNECFKEIVDNLDKLLETSATRSYDPIGDFCLSEWEDVLNELHRIYKSRGFYVDIVSNERDYHIVISYRTTIPVYEKFFMWISSLFKKGE